jgi:hypothetical protein
MVDVSINWQRHEFDYGGEKISVELHPMRQKPLFALLAITAMTADEKQVDVMLDIFTRYVRKIENLTVNGQPVTNEDLVNETVFMKLSGMIMERLNEISNLSKADEKN